MLWETVYAHDINYFPDRNILSWMSKNPAMQKVLQVDTGAKLKSVECDKTHECPDRTTCCRVSKTQWGCCPSPNVSDLSVTNAYYVYALFRCEISLSLIL